MIPLFLSKHNKQYYRQNKKEPLITIMNWLIVLQNYLALLSDLVFKQ